MSIGIPCISSNIPTSRYVLGDKGLFYNTIDELKVLILELKNNKDLYNEQAKYSIERAKLFHKDNVKKIWKKYLFRENFYRHPYFLHPLVSFYIDI